MHKLTQDTIEKVKQLRLLKLSFEQVSAQLGISKNTAQHAARLGGIVKSKLTDEQKEEIRQKRVQGVERKVIAQEYGLSLASVSEITKGLDLGSLETDIDSVVQDYRNGDSHRQIAEKHGLKIKSVASVLSRAGVQRKNMSDDEKKQVIADRLAGMSRKDLSSKYGLTESGVKSLLSRNSVVPPQELVSANVVAGRTLSYLATSGVSTHNELMAQYATSRGGVFLGNYTSALEPVNWECSKGHTFSMRPNSVQQGQWCPSCAHVGPSRAQLELAEFVASCGFSPEVGNRKALQNPQTNRGLELDVFVESKSFGIEFNGLIWHSEKYTESGRHLTKALAARQAQVNLLAVFEDEWAAKPDLIKGMIRHRLGILGTKYRASKLMLRRISDNKAMEPFFERNHLDGHTRASYGYGLFDGDKLISCMSVRTNHQKEREIARFATDYDCHVYGGAGRLVKAIMAEEPVLYTFSNNRLSSGEVYQKLGFEHVADNKPSYWYTDGKERIWRYRCKRINDPEFLAKYPEVPHTEKDQAAGGLHSLGIWGDRRPLWKIEDYGHRKWVLKRASESGK